VYVGVAVATASRQYQSVALHTGITSRTYVCAVSVLTAVHLLMQAQKLIRIGAMRVNLAYVSVIDIQVPLRDWLPQEEVEAFVNSSGGVFPAPQVCVCAYNVTL
jgi:hypothetical protein